MRRKHRRRIKRKVIAFLRDIARETVVAVSVSLLLKLTEFLLSLF